MAITTEHDAGFDRDELEASLAASESASGPIKEIVARTNEPKKTVTTHDMFGDAPATIHLVIEGETTIEVGWRLDVRGTAFIASASKPVAIYR